ncbi:MAG: (d)CMP kinase [Erysipelotrichaceae bacterium]
MSINIAIDGPSAAGKSTIAKCIAKMLNYKHLDTGAMYRCVGLQAIKTNTSFNDEEKLCQMIDQMKIDFGEDNSVFINREDVSKAIRENDISMAASICSAHPLVRIRLVAMQKEIAKVGGYILDGRDIGTVVLPNAELKIYMVATVEARAKRRFLEYKNKGIEMDYKKIYEDIEQRDDQDMHREASPLKKSEDAIEIDTSNMSIQEVCDYVVSLLQDLNV